MAKNRKIEKRNRGNDTCSTRPGNTHKTPQDQDWERAWGSNMQAVWWTRGNNNACSQLSRKIAQTEDKKRRDKVATWTHWRLCQIYNLPNSNNWYEHLAETFIETPQVKILWDFNIQTDKAIDARCPDTVVTNKDKQGSRHRDIAILGDLLVREKEMEKREKYQDLAMEFRRLWKASLKVAPIIRGVLGTIGNARSDLKMLAIKDGTEMIRTTALLGSAHILRKTLSL